MSNKISEINVLNKPSLETINSVFATTFCANIDSINISASKKIFVLLDSKKDNYTLELLKRKESGFCDEKRYFKFFGKSMYNSYVDKNGKQRRSCPFIDIWAVISANGVVIRLARPSGNKDIYKLDLGGLQQFDEGAKNLVETLQNLWPHMQDYGISRVDVSVDFFGPLPEEIEQVILTSRRKEVYKNTMYYPTLKQTKKRNSYVNILVYDKTKKNKYLAKHGQITRLEFSFGSLLKKFKLSDFEDAKKAMVKYVKNVGGIKIAISKIVPKKTVSNSSALKYVKTISILLKLKKQESRINRQLMLLAKVTNDILHLYILIDTLRQNNYYFKQILLEKRINKERDMFERGIKQKNNEIEIKMEEQSSLIMILSRTVSRLNEDCKQLIDITDNMQNTTLDQKVEWIGLAEVAMKKVLTKDAVRKQLYNGDFEDKVDYKREGNKILVHQGAIGRIQRKRRSSNG